MRVVNVSLSPASIDNALDVLDAYMKDIENGCKELEVRLAERGAEDAQREFNGSEYTGVMDVVVTATREDDQSAVVATGSNTLFIEFGTGITNPDNHPEKGVDGLVGHGQYGFGQGANPKGWVYVGATGTAPRTTAIGKNKVHTYGNRANMCMYFAKQKLKEDASDIAREVFK